MLFAVAMFAVLCAWFVAARDRAKLDDELITKVNDVWVVPRGPKWLAVLGPNCFHRKVVAVSLGRFRESQKEIEEQLARLRQLPDMRCLFLRVDRVTPAMIDALSGMTQLRTLSLITSREPLPPDCLAAIGKMKRLEHFSLEDAVVSSDSIARLAELKQLKTLNLDGVMAAPPPLLAQLPLLPRLDMVCLSFSETGDEDIGRLPQQPRLRSLRLRRDEVGAAGLARLAACDTLEELAIDGDTVSGSGLISLTAIPHLKSLHVGNRYDNPWEKLATLTLDHDDAVNVLTSELAGCRSALERLRQSKPGITVDGDWHAFQWNDDYMLPADCEPADHFAASLPLVPWLDAKFWRQGRVDAKVEQLEW